VRGPLDFGPFLLLEPEARAALAQAAEPISYRAGTTVLREGEEGDAAYALVAGRVRVLSGPTKQTLAVLAAPVLVGELAVLSGEPRNATVVALARSRGIRLPAPALRAAMASSAAFASGLEEFARERFGANFLRRSSPFADLPSRTIEELAAKLEPARFAAGDVLLREGERGDDAYLIRAGEVEVLRAGSSERVLRTLGAGSFVGEVAALTGTARTATVRAKGAVESFRLAAADVQPILKRHRALVERLESVMQARHSPERIGAVAVSPAPDDPRAWVVREEASGTYLRLTGEALAIFEDLDGERTLRELAFRHFERTGLLDPEAVFSTVATLQSAGLVSAPRIAADEPGWLLRAADLLLAPRAELQRADALASRLYAALGFAFTRPGAVVALALGVTGLVALARVFRQASPSDFGLGGLVVAFVGLLLAGIGHETAHALAAKAEGRRIGRAGIGLLWLTPVIYVDTSDAWLIHRRRRILVNAAGPLFNLALAGALGFVAAATGGVVQNVAVWLAVVNLASIAFNLSPLLEYDGYYVLSDLLNVNALRRKALRFVFRDLIDGPHLPRTRLEAAFLAYAVAVFVYVLVLNGLLLVGTPQLVDGLLADQLDPAMRETLGIAVALVLAGLTIAPFAAEIASTRRDTGPP